MTIRLRLTLIYVCLLVAATTGLLTMSWWLLDRQLERTVPTAVANDVMVQVGAQYVLATVGAALFAIGVGWLAAGQALAPIRAISATARRITEQRLDARVQLAPEAPADELNDLARTFDAMLDRVQAAVTAQDRFVANASHELRTPLTAIRAEAEVALDDPHASPEELREALASAITTCERTEDLLAGLLLLASSHAGSRRNERVELEAVAQRAVASSRPEATASGQDVRLRTATATVWGDEALLERLVGNLVENAVRHGDAREPVQVDVGPGEDAAVRIRVTNSGAPIPAEVVERLTQPFERLNRTRGGGTGLGLSIVRAVAEAHGGTLKLVAPRAGGLTSEVVLPAAA